jgi:hypothetical protein
VPRSAHLVVIQAVAEVVAVAAVAATTMTNTETVASRRRSFVTAADALQAALIPARSWRA